VPGCPKESEQILQIYGKYLLLEELALLRREFEYCLEVEDFDGVLDVEQVEENC